MSASPQQAPTGSTPRNGTAPLKIIRKKKNDNPLIAPRRPMPQPRPTIQPRPQPKPRSNGVSRADGLIAAAPQASTAQQLLGQRIPIMIGSNPESSGFSDPSVKEGTYTDYELWTTKRELREGLRFHMARFMSKHKVDPRKERDFQRPVRLHRRDPRSKAPKMEEPVKTEVNGVDSKDKDLEDWRTKREEEREANLAQIAPDAVTGAKRKKISSQKAAEVYGVNQTDEQKAKSILRYEEALPWHLEDFDNKNTWMGSYEEAMSHTNAALSFENGKAVMIPVEKWYKFTRKDLFKTMTIDEVEKSLQKKTKEPRWMMQHIEAEKDKKTREAMTKMQKGLYVGKEARDDVARGGRRGDDDADEIDADGADEFADDEEDPLFDADEEDMKAITKRLKKDALQANVFDLKEEGEYEKEELREKKEKEQEKILGKAVRKALKRREKRFVYDSDDSEYNNPFSDSSSTTDSEEERSRETPAKLTEPERRPKEKTTAKTQPPSGTSTKGTNTPSGRPKHTDPLKVKQKSLKRPGSDDLSELSGTDSSRKKPKKKHAAGTSTPQPSSKLTSPAYSVATAAPSAPSPSQPTQRKSSTTKPSMGQWRLSSAQPIPKKRTYITAGSGSEAEGAGTAGSGPEMSDGGTTKKKLKINPPGHKSPKGTPAGSRAGSPKPPSTAASAQKTSTPQPPQIQQQNLAFPTVAEIKAILPPEGLKVAQIASIFGTRIQARMKDFTALVREAGEFKKDSGRVVPYK